MTREGSTREESSTGVFEGPDEEGVPRQKCQGSPENRVIGRFPPSQGGIVHFREVIMDEGSGMDHFASQGQRQKVLPRNPEGFPGQDAKEGPDPFPAREKRVGH